MKRGYKWIENEMALLDPETEYEKILSLLAQYQLNDFILNISYTINFMDVIIAPVGSDTLMHTRKVTEHKQKRFDDSLDFFWVWYIAGPSSTLVKESVERLNKMHAAIGRQLPGNFSGNDDFVQPLCLMAAFSHRMRLQLGLPGLPEYLQIAFHNWLRDFSQLFTTETESGRIENFPKDFDGLLAFADEFESREYPTTENGRRASQALIQQFCERWFPRPLWGLGRTIILTFTPASVRRVHALGDPHPLLRWLVERGMKNLMLAQERLLPDPQQSLLERKAQKGKLSRILQRLHEYMSSQAQT